MEFLRRKFAVGGARRYVQLLRHRSVSVVDWKNARKTFFRGFTVYYSFRDSNGSGRKQWFGLSRSHTIAQRRWVAWLLMAIFTQKNQILVQKMPDSLFRPRKNLLERTVTRRLNVISMVHVVWTACVCAPVKRAPSKIELAAHLKLLCERIKVLGFAPNK